MIKADMVFTDPPYVLFGNSTGVQGIADDKMVQPFFRSIGENIKRNLKVQGHAYVSCDWQTSSVIKDCTPLTPKNLIVWRKAQGGGLGSFYTKIYELIWFFTNEEEVNFVTGKKTGRYAKSRTINGVPNIWDVPIVQSKDRYHVAEKPIKLISIAIENSSDEGETVLDLFGGSGSTLIASEKLNRKCRTMEIEPKYCDVIIKRWEQLTGKKAELVKE